jgi:uncharacterized membrane protein
MEQMVGGVWLQNAGSVLVLLGVFFLILWGWSTRRIGPGALIGAGVLLGFGIAWRGDRTRRTLPGIGHALVGIGLGVVYLALYLGHFTLHALAGPVTFAALVATATLTVLAGLRYRVQAIAMLGMIGAFLPQVLANVLPPGDLTLAPGALLGYMAVVDAFALVLALRVGWSALALATVLLGAGTWVTRVPDGVWSWPLEIGLSAVFVTLGLSPLPWLVRAEGRVRPVDLALVSVAPLALIGCSWPMWAAARPEHVAILLFTIAALYLGAAAWVDARRPEGVVLLSLGLDARGGWLRFCGYVVVTVGGLWLLDRLAMPQTMDTHPLPIVNADAIRDAVAIAAILFAGLRMRAGRERLTAGEAMLPAFVVGGANLMLLFWTHREATHLAWSFEGGGGRWRPMPDPAAAPGRIREVQFSMTATALAWLAQAGWLIRASLRAPIGQRWPFLRHAGYAVGTLALIESAATLLVPDGWARDLLPVLHRDGLLSLAGALVIAAVATGLARSRPSLSPGERQAPEVWAAGAALVLLMWIGREADHVARQVLDVPGAYSSAWHDEAAAARGRLHSLIPTLTSVGWLIQALSTLAIGWWRRSAFLRWMGLGLVGITALKIVIVDLSDADPFWRFLAAIAAGIAMLVVSYAYQRRKRREETRAESGQARC